MKKSTILYVSIFLAFLLISLDMSAQGGFGNLDGIDFNDDVNDEPVPIFGHLFLFISLAVGFVLGRNKLRNK